MKTTISHQIKIREKEERIIMGRGKG